MTFGAPEWFIAFLLAPVLLWIFLHNEGTREELLRKLVATRLLPDLAASTSTPRRVWKFALALLGLACVIAALTQPRVGYEVIDDHRRGLDLLIAIDTSKSMLSTDVQPDRLSRAKFAAQDLIDSLVGDRVGLVAFAGTAFVQAPLTIDYSAVEAALTDLDTSTIPRGGTNIASAIRQAADAFGKGESASRALILFTDGEELEDDAVAAAKEVNGKFRIFTVGMGTPEGSLIPVQADGGGTDFVKDDQGQYVKSHLDEAKLKEIAEATGGFYIHMDNGPATAKAIITQGLERMQQREFETHENRPIERYEWPLAAGIVLLMTSMVIRERRRPPRRAVRRVRQAAALAGTAALLMLMPSRGWAVNPALQLYDQKDYKDASDLFQKQLVRNPDSDGLEFDQGAAAYKEGDYDKALEAFGKVIGSQDQTLRGQAEYNLGNTLVQRGALQESKDEKIKEWNGAINHYVQALKIDPKNVDAQYNEDLIKKMIDDLNKKEQQQKQQNQQQQQKQDQKNQPNQQNQKQQNQDQQNQKQQSQQQQDQQQSQQNQNQQSQQNQQAQNQQNQQNSGQGQNQQNQQNQQAQNQQQSQQNGGQGQQQQDQQAQAQPNQQSNSRGQQQPQNQQNGSQGQQNPQQTAGRQGQDEQNQASNDQSQGMNGPSPSPTPRNGPGVLKEQSQNDQQSEARAAARGATEQAQPGEMTPSQAQALIDSLRGEDEHVSFEDRHDNPDEHFKDW